MDSLDSTAWAAFEPRLEAVMLSVFAPWVVTPERCDLVIEAGW